MEHELSIDLLRRLKLHGYTALLPKGEQEDHKQLFMVSNYPIKDLKDKIHGEDYISIESLLLMEDKFELEGIVLLPKEGLASAL